MSIIIDKRELHMYIALVHNYKRLNFQLQTFRNPLYECNMGKYKNHKVTRRLKRV